MENDTNSATRSPAFFEKESGTKKFGDVENDTNSAIRSPLSLARLSNEVQQAVKGKDFGRGTKAESFSGSVIEQGDNTVNIRLGDGMKVEFLGEVLAKQAVGIFV